MPKPGLPWRPKPPPILSYGVAVLSASAALIFARWLEPYLLTAPSAAFIFSIALSAWVGGIGPGLLAAVLLIMADAYYFEPPIYSLAVKIEYIPRFLIFAAAALFVGWLSAMQRNADEALRLAIEDLETTNAALQAEAAEHRRADEALRNAQAELARVARLTTMGELVASIAHELNQPLAAAVTSGDACLSWLSRDVPALDEARRSVLRITRDVQRAVGMIRSLRALAKKSEPHLSEFDITGAIQEVLALIRSELLRHGVVLHTDLSADLRPVFGDRVQLQQVLLNLITNGVDAMSAVTDRPKMLAISSKPVEAGGVLVAVEDSGTGLDPATADRIFDPFFTTKPDGMGMGLRICRSIIDAHGGRFWAAPRVPCGAAFRFTVPGYRRVERNGFRDKSDPAGFAGERLNPARRPSRI
ncbi:MAG: protein NO-binding rane sensor [Rhodospirillales bacterium]|nr:protein NO-binding rane sensor [Rhodospirillales bacterium]